ncbi:MAG: penicillin acylase family protein [Flavobacteriaceae bacterium]
MKKASRIISILILIILGGYFLILNRYEPQYEGNLESDQIKEVVQVLYDENGVPHIEAKNNHDAYFALGYVHAQDRLWQMELMRRIAPGRLSEILGEATIETDKLFKAMGLEEYHEQSLKYLEENEAYYQMAIAYLAGVNEFIEKGNTPIEFDLIGIKKENYTIKDILNVVGYMSFSFSQAQQTDPLISAVFQELGPEYGKTIDGKTDPNTTLIKNYKNDALSYANHVKNLTAQLPVPAFIGSNSWVLGPEKTEQGKVIFANDPHMGYSQPGVWYQAHLKTPNYEMYGFHLGLIPFPLLGHNRDYAYGLTMFQNDDMDFYKVKSVGENNYKYKDSLIAFTSRNYEVKVGEKEVIEMEVKQTIHGPVVNDIFSSIPSDEDPVSLSWVYTKRENHLLEALYGISHATNMKEFKTGASLIHAPGLNVMYGDANDNIAWWASAQLYKVKNGASTLQLMDGSNGEDDQIEWLTFENNPMAENPSWNYVYSANNQPDSILGDLYPGYYLSEDRAKRIVSLLDETQLKDSEDIQKMIGDNTSSTASELIESLNVEMENPLWNQLSAWDGSFEKNLIEPTLFTRFYYELLKAAMLDELGENKFEIFLNTHLQTRYTETLFQDEGAIWWDDVASSEVIETREEIARAAWKATLSKLEFELGSDSNQWKWGRIHQLTHNHVMKDVPILGNWLNVGAFEISGGNEVINNQLYKFNETGLYPVTAGPSSRRIIDFSNISESKGMIPTGQSGNPFSKHYDDMAERFVKNEFFTMYLNKEQFEAIASTLIIEPKNN